jgi:hypothetical protein
LAGAEGLNVPGSLMDLLTDAREPTGDCVTLFFLLSPAHGAKVAQFLLCDYFAGDCWHVLVMGAMYCYGYDEPGLLT